MAEIIADLIQQINAKAHGRATGFVIGNTSSDMPADQDFYITSPEETADLIYAGVIVKNIETAAWVAQSVDGQVNYIFVDAEKKIKKIYYGPDDFGNIERAVRKAINQSAVLTYKGNSLAVEAIGLLFDQLVVDAGGVEVAIIGAGNVGSKIALMLVECGAPVRLFRRNLDKLKKITDGLNQIKSEHTMAAVTMAENIEEACRGVHVVIGCSGQQSIGKEDLKYLSQDRPPILIDAGKCCFAEDVVNDPELKIFSLDISIVQKSIFSAILKTKEIYNHEKDFSGRG